MEEVVLAQEQKEEPKKVDNPKIGDSVVIIANNPTFGWGSMEKGDYCIITNIEGALYSLQNAEKGIDAWTAERCDFELVTKPKDLADIKIVGAKSSPNDGWHTTWKVTNGKFSESPLMFEGVPMGCGLGQVHGISSILYRIKAAIKNPKPTKKDLKIEVQPLVDCLNRVYKRWKFDGVGAILATLGQNYYEYEPLLLAAGFKKISEYKNWRHGNNYTQRLYIFKIK